MISINGKEYQGNEVEAREGKIYIPYTKTYLDVPEGSYVVITPSIEIGDTLFLPDGVKTSHP